MASQSTSAARTHANVIMSDDPEALRSQEQFGFCDAVTAGDKIYLSGIVAVLNEGETDVEASFERVYQRVGSILKRAGVTWDDIVDITSFHTDVTTQIEPMVKVQKRYIKSPPPAWTAIGIDRLIRPNGITEIKFVAQRHGTGG
ncbi:MAG: hypothetical protein JWN69_2154 [Alphaproteobacteria bacterium]|nr:hypothetical protein [Alphaproteobacteria bacterium]